MFKNRNQPDDILVKENLAIGVGDHGFDIWIGQIGTVSPSARHRCDVSFELCCPGAKLRRWAPPLVRWRYATSSGKMGFLKKYEFSQKYVSFTGMIFCYFILDCNTSYLTTESV